MPQSVGWQLIGHMVRTTFEPSSVTGISQVFANDWSAESMLQEFTNASRVPPVHQPGRAFRHLMQTRQKYHLRSVRGQVSIPALIPHRCAAQRERGSGE
jgi:hypothetical protein